MRCHAYSQLAARGCKGFFLTVPTAIGEDVLGSGWFSASCQIVCMLASAAAGVRGVTGGPGPYRHYVFRLASATEPGVRGELTKLLSRPRPGDCGRFL